MWTAAGHDGPSTTAAMRAGVSGAQTGLLWDPASGETLNAFRVNAHQWWEGETFLPHLLAPVILEIWRQLDRFGAIDPGSVPILVNLAPVFRSGRSAELGRTVLDRLPDLIGRPWPNGSALYFLGRIGLPFLLTKARRLGAPLAILIGAESLLRQDIIEEHLRKGRVLCPKNSSGFIAGEAAAALLVSPGRRAGLAIIGMGHGREAHGEGGTKDTPIVATGLTEAMRMALFAARTEFYDINLSMGDLNGEHFKFKEHAFATMRLDRLPPEGRSRRPRGYVEHWNVVETIGEVGASHMLAAAGWAFEAGRSSYLPGKVIFSAGEDDGQRVAVVGEWSDG
jgi:3-oxoacyl-[acyl-carrier-protein] synthase-1